MKQIFRREVLIGACVLIALAILFIGIDFLKGINVFKAANYYYATYSNVEGLANSAPVTVNGFKVGLVREINYEYDNPGHVQVEISLDKALKVPKGTKALLVTDLLGTASIALEMPAATDYHNVGDQLIGENRIGMMDNLSNNVMPKVEAIVPKVDTLLTSINRLVGDPALLAAVQRLDGITNNLEATTRAIHSSAKSLPTVMNNVTALSASASSVANRIDELLASIDSTQINSTIDNLNQTSASLKTLAASLNNPDGTIGRLINDPSVYDNLNTILKDIDQLVTDIKAEPKRYIPPIKIF